MINRLEKLIKGNSIKINELKKECSEFDSLSLDNTVFIIVGLKSMSSIPAKNKRIAIKEFRNHKNDKILKVYMSKSTYKTVLLFEWEKIKRKLNNN